MGLVLGSGELLTVPDLLSWRLPQCRLVTLSACESALPPLSGGDRARGGGDCIGGLSAGMPGAFMASGCPCVVGSLWKVSDASTTALMVKFYELLHGGEGKGVGECLCAAQKWLRRARMSEVLSLLPKSARDAWEREQRERRGQRMEAARAERVAANRQKAAVNAQACSPTSNDRRAAMRSCHGGSRVAGGRLRPSRLRGEAAGSSGLGSRRRTGITERATTANGDKEKRVISAFSSPFYWAPFTVIGQGW